MDCTTFNYVSVKVSGWHDLSYFITLYKIHGSSEKRMLACVCGGFEKADEFFESS